MRPLADLEVPARTPIGQIGLSARTVDFSRAQEAFLGAVAIWAVKTC